MQRQHDLQRVHEIAKPQIRIVLHEHFLVNLLGLPNGDMPQIDLKAVDQKVVLAIGAIGKVPCQDTSERVTGSRGELYAPRQQPALFFLPLQIENVSKDEDFQTSTSKYACF